MADAKPDVFELVGRGLELAERVEGLGPIGLGVLAWRSLSPESRERVLGQVCELCGDPRSRCECCAACGFTPCACDVRFGNSDGQVVDVEGVAVG